MAKVEVRMPKMGESITEGTVVVWHKKPGDAIAMDESLLEIGTDKVDTDVPSPGAGTLAEILVPEGETVDVGTVIAVIDTSGDASSAVVDSPESVDAAPESGDGVAGDSTELAVEKATPDAAVENADVVAKSPAVVSEIPDVAAEGVAEGIAEVVAGASIPVVMPKMGESITEGTILTWLKSPGDKIGLDEMILEIATDKVDTEIPAPSAGILQEILVPEGETVAVGTTIALIATGDAPSAQAPAAVSAPVSASIEAPASTVVPTAAAAAVATVSSVSKGTNINSTIEGRFYSPLVRSIAAEEGLNEAELASIPGTGRDGRVNKNDVLAYVQSRGISRPASGPSKVSTPILASDSPVPEKAPGDRVEVIKMDRMRQLIAEHMTRSKATSAHVTSFGEVDVTNLVRLRERNKDAFLEREGVKLTYTPFFVYAAVEALRDHPILNSSIVGDEIHIQKDYHIGIAVAIGKTGLVVPVIRSAGQKNLVGLAHSAADLAARTRNKQLLPDELQGGTFTVTNVGSLGSVMGTPIINQPQVGILATGVIKKRPVVIEGGVMGDTIGVRHMMFVSLSYDHRIVDGAMGSSFLQRYVDVLESFDPGEIIK